MNVKFVHYAKASNVRSAPVLLWENASPTSEFSDSVVLPVDYDAYMIEYRYSTSDASTGISYFVNDADVYGSAAQVKYQYAQNYVAGRKFVISDTGINFAGISGFYLYARVLASSATGGAVGNAYGIPTRIWGVNFAL